MIADYTNPYSRGDNSLAVLPQGSGKSLVIAEFARRLNIPVLILAPTQEIITQNRAKLRAIVPAEDIGTYSASLKEKTISKFTFATIQSVYKKPQEFAHFPVVIIDECHLLSPREINTMYMRFFAGIGNPKVYGLSATPWRNELVYQKVNDELYAAIGVKMCNRMWIKGEKKSFWKKILHTTSHSELLDGGYLSPIEYVHNSLVPYEAIPVNISHSDFNLEGYSKMIIGFEANILNTIAEAQRRYSSVLVFCVDVAQANRLSEIIKGSRVVTGDTPKKQRTAIIEGFKDGTIQTVFNVNCLNTGFDHPDLRCVINLRPIKSPSLILQLAGRLTRTSPTKTHGTLIDLTGTYKHFGPIEEVEVYKKDGWAWTFKSAYVDDWHDKMLFKMKVQKEKKVVATSVNLDLPF